MDHISSSTFLPLSYNFLHAPASFPHHIDTMHDQVEEPTLHCCANFIRLQNGYLQCFWQEQMHAMGCLSVYEQHQLPLARVKRVMKLNRDVKMVSVESTVLLSKACEFFILELALRSWLHVEERRRQMLLRSDIASAVFHADTLDFFVDIVDGTKDEEDGEICKGNWANMKR